MKNIFNTRYKIDDDCYLISIDEEDDAYQLEIYKNGKNDPELKTLFIKDDTEVEDIIEEIRELNRHLGVICENDIYELDLDL